MLRLPVAALLFLRVSVAAPIDGRWIARHQQPGTGRVLVAELRLKSEGKKLSGVVKGKKDDAEQRPIQGGSIDGNRITFRTHFAPKNDKAQTVVWTGELREGKLFLIRTVEGKKRGIGFVGTRP